MVWSCVLGSLFHDKQDDFEHFSASLYEKRWHEVIKFAQAAWPLIKILRVVWDATKYGDRAQREPEDGDQAANKAGAAAFDLQLITASMRDNLFFCYMSLLLQVDALPEKVSRWAEGCSCHELIMVGKSPFRRSTLLGGHPCPMAGKRAPELAAGHIPEVLNALCRLTVGETILRHGPLNAADLAKITRDFTATKGHIELVLRTKTDFWQRVPWLLCGLSHDNATTASRVARECLAAFVGEPNAELHHRLTRRFMREPLRSQIQRMADGFALETLSAEFRSEIARLRFVPVTETTIETKHAVVTRAGKRVTNAAPVVHSLSNRLPALERRLRDDESG